MVPPAIISEIIPWVSLQFFLFWYCNARFIKKKLRIFILLCARILSTTLKLSLFKGPVEFLCDAIWTIHMFVGKFFNNFISSMNICPCFHICLEVCFIKLYFSGKLSIFPGSHQNLEVCGQLKVKMLTNEL